VLLFLAGSVAASVAATRRRARLLGVQRGAAGEARVEAPR
jgi:hypothetical protein